MTEINLYEDLDRRIADAYATADQLSKKPDQRPSLGHLANVATRRETLPAEVRAWADQDLFLGPDAAMKKLEAFDEAFTVTERPTSLDEWLELSPNLAKNLQELHAAKQRLCDNDRRSLSGKPLGDDFHLIVMPWGEFKHRIDQQQFIEWSNQMRTIQKEYEPGQTLMKLAHDGHSLTWQANLYDKRIYWDQQPGTQSAIGQRITTADYLTKKIANEGDWGVMLVQTTPITKLPDEQPFDEPIDEREQLLTINGIKVGAMGILEWEATSWQDLKHLFNSPVDELLPANMLEDDQVGDGMTHLILTSASIERFDGIDMIRACFVTRRNHKGWRGLNHDNPPRLAVAPSGAKHD